MRRNQPPIALDSLLYYTALIVFVLFLALFIRLVLQTFVEQVWDLHTPCSIDTKTHASHNAFTPHERVGTDECESPVLELVRRAPSTVHGALLSTPCRATGLAFLGPAQLRAIAAGDPWKNTGKTNGCGVPARRPERRRRILLRVFRFRVPCSGHVLE